ncbi:MAG: hypothetical protein ACU83O_15115, partial [Gammaproteobacteria bacterium]
MKNILLVLMVYLGLISSIFSPVYADSDCIDVIEVTDSSISAGNHYSHQAIAVHVGQEHGISPGYLNRTVLLEKAATMAWTRLQRSKDDSRSAYGAKECLYPRRPIAGRQS